MPMSPRLLRPRASGLVASHPEALDWATRVTANGGSVSPATFAAVSRLCASIDSAGIRNRFYRLNLFCGDQLAAALVPLYRAESSTASVRGNATDTNNNFVAADFNNTGSASGLQGNGTSKSLNTGIAFVTFTLSNAHMGVGLRTAATVSGYRAIIGVSGGTINELSISSRRGDGTSRAAIFGAFNNVNQQAGESVFASALSVGDLVAAHPTFYRNGASSGSSATSSGASTGTAGVAVFAFNNGGTFQGWSDVRLNWYSLGLTMTGIQVASFTNIVQAFNNALSRT